MTDYSFTTSRTATSPVGMMALGAALGKTLKTGDVVLLYGDLGAGKTTFSRGLIQSLASQATEIVSPTFTLVQTYDVGNTTLYHYDLYRLEIGDASTLTELGWDESLTDGITLVEWPERLTPEFIPANALTIRIETEADQSRRLDYSGHEKWRHRLQEA
jgi:tRNA threonylcarbamoyl adenosine modification protein YjeE